MVLLFWLFTKHLICDFPLQTKFQYLNKGTYGHPGGLLHAFIHVVGTALVVTLFGPGLFTGILVGLVDGAIHYHIDWAKMNINTKYGLKPDNSEKFWWLLGLDQYLHCLTYLLIASIL